MNARLPTPPAPVEKNDYRHDTTVESLVDGFAEITRLIGESSTYHYSDQAAALAKVLARVDAERARLATCLEVARELGEERAAAEWDARHNGGHP